MGGIKSGRPRTIPENCIIVSSYTHIGNRPMRGRSNIFRYSFYDDILKICDIRTDDRVLLNVAEDYFQIKACINDKSGYKIISRNKASSFRTYESIKEGIYQYDSEIDSEWHLFTLMDSKPS